MRRHVDELRVKLLAAAVEATMRRGPNQVVDELSICVGLLAEAQQRGNVPPELIARAERSLEQWAHFSDESGTDGH